MYKSFFPSCCPHSLGWPDCRCIHICIQYIALSLSIVGDFCLVCIIWVPCRVGQCPIAACRWTSLLDDFSFWLFWLWIRTPGFLDEHHTPNKNPLQQWDQRWDPSPLTDPPHFSNVFFFGGWWCFFLWGRATQIGTLAQLTHPYLHHHLLCNPGCLVRFIHWWNSSCSSDLDAFSLDFFSGNFVKNSSNLQGPFGDDDDDVVTRPAAGASLPPGTADWAPRARAQTLGGSVVAWRRGRRRGRTDSRGLEGSQGVGGN